jgi:hypothetical protein
MYNLTDKQMQIVRDLVRLCQASQHRSFSYTPTFNNRDTVSAHGTSMKVAGSERDLRTVEVEGMITLRWVRHGAANGTVLPRAFEAVKENFGLPPVAPAAAVASAAPVMVEHAAAPAAAIPTMIPVVIPLATPVATSAAMHAAVPSSHSTGPRSAATRTVLGHRPPAAVADAPSPAPAGTAPAAAPGSEILFQLSRSIADLSAAFREALPLDEAEAAEADTAAINRQLHARQPDAEMVARRTRSVVARVSLAMSDAADVAEKGPRYADSLRKLASFVSLIGQWTAAHHRGD